MRTCLFFSGRGRARFATLETRALEFFESFQIYPKFRQSSRRIEFVFSFATILSNIVGLDVEGLRKRKRKMEGGEKESVYFSSINEKNSPVSLIRWIRVPFWSFG